MKSRHSWILRRSSLALHLRRRKRMNLSRMLCLQRSYIFCNVLCPTRSPTRWRMNGIGAMQVRMRYCSIVTSLKEALCEAGPGEKLRPPLHRMNPRLNPRMMHHKFKTASAHAKWNPLPYAVNRRVLPRNIWRSRNCQRPAFNASRMRSYLIRFAAGCFMMLAVSRATLMPNI